MMSGALTAGWRAWGLDDRSEVDSQRKDPRDEISDSVRLLRFGPSQRINN